MEHRYLGLAAKMACVLIPAITITSCEQKTTADESQLKQEISQLTQTVNNQTWDIATLKLQMEALLNKAVMIDVTSPSYQTIDTNTGKFLIACDNVQPYADGQKLTFRIGNPHFITFSGFKLKIKWGPKSPQYQPDPQKKDSYATWQTAYANWQKLLNEKEIDSVVDLKPGLWNSVEVVLSPARAEDLAYLEMSMSTDKVSLYREKAH